MPIRKRGQAWQIDVQIDKKRIRRDFRGSKKEAIQAEIDIRKELNADLAPVHQLENALLKYLKEYVPHLKSSRSQTYKCNRLRPYIENKSFNDVSDIVKELKGLRLKPATINRLLAVLRRLCNLAFKEWGWLDRPVNFSLLPERNQRHIYLSPAQVNKIVKNCQYKGSKDAILVAAYTGMRRGELFTLEKSSVRDGFIYLGTDTKTGKPRTIPIHKKIKKIKFPLKITDALLRSDWEQARIKAELEYVHFHDLRHTFASWMVQKGIELYTVGQILGHTETQTTARYSHLRNSDLKAAMGKI